MFGDWLRRGEERIQDIAAPINAAIRFNACWIAVARDAYSDVC